MTFRNNASLVGGRRTRRFGHTGAPCSTRSGKCKK